MTHLGMFKIISGGGYNPRECFPSDTERMSESLMRDEITKSCTELMNEQKIVRVGYKYYTPEAAENV